MCTATQALLQCYGTNGLSLHSVMLLLSCPYHATVQDVCRSTKHVLSVKISNKVAVGHAQLPRSVLQSLKLQQHGRLRLQSITSATQIHPRFITLHPVPYPAATSHGTTSPGAEAPRLVEELSQQDLKQLLAAWLAAQASGGADSSQQEEEHVPVQQGSLFQIAGDDVALTGGQAHNMAFQIHMKQPPSLLQAPTAAYALLSAADLAPSSGISVSQGDSVAAPKWAFPQQASLQWQQQQASMVSSSQAMHAAANTALQHVLPMLASPCR